MADSWTTRIKNAYNAFQRGDESQGGYFSDYGSASFGTGRPDRPRLNTHGDRSIISSIYTRLGIDVASVDIRHVRLDEHERFAENIKSDLNNCLTLEANIDQGSRAFKQDIAMTLFDKGVAAIVPVDTSSNPDETTGFSIYTMRVGEVISWMPFHVRVRLYNDRSGKKEEITLPKAQVAIVENPLYSVMNETNSTLQRLIRKLSLLDMTDEQNSSGKLDMIIQLPYSTKTETRRNEADKRRSEMELQLRSSKYGVAYIDINEKVTQLNRPVDNSLLGQVVQLKTDLFDELGLTAEVFKGTADEATMLNYNNRTIEPIVTAITQAMKRTFLTKTARTQGHSIEAFRDPFKLVPVASMAEIADKFTRNEILTSNEIRQALGFKPSSDEKADQLINSNNVKRSEDEVPRNVPPTPEPPPTKPQPQAPPAEPSLKEAIRHARNARKGGLN